MPIFRLPAGGLGYFADIPGCHGAATILGLEARFGELAFYNSTHTDAPRSKRWSRTSPQHVGRATLKRLFPADFFAVSFAVVRHPLDRLRAVYLFQRYVEGAVPRSTDFHDWLEDTAERMEDEPWVFDNAVRPMTEMIPEGAEVFRLEDGTAAVDAWLDRLAAAPGPAIAPTAGDAGILVSPFDLDRIVEIYAADYARFGYGAEPGDVRTQPAAARPGRFARILRRGNRAN